MIGMDAITLKIIAHRVSVYIVAEAGHKRCVPPARAAATA